MFNHKTLLSLLTLCLTFACTTTAAPPKTKTIDETKFASVAEIKSIVNRICGKGLRLPGSAIHDGIVDYIEHELKLIPGLEIVQKNFSLQSWQPVGDSLHRAGGLSIEEESVPIVGAIPYTLPTNGTAISGPLVYIPNNTSLTSVDIQGKVVMRDFLLLPIPIPYIASADYYATPDTNTSGYYIRPFVSPPDTDLLDAGLGGAAGYISAFNVPREQVESYYDGHEGIHWLVPGVYIGSEQYYQLRNASDAGKTASLTIDASLGKKSSRELFATLPGSTKETIVILSHTDGATYVQENGAAALLTLAKYFAAQPLSSRKHTLEFAFTSGHLAYSRDGNFVYAEQLNRNYEKGDVALVIALEHLGTRELEPSPAANGTYGNILNFTGNGEPMLWSVGPMEPVINAVTNAVKGRNLDHVQVTAGFPPANASQVPLYQSQGGIGSYYHALLVPTTSLISGPWSLWAPGFGASAIDFKRLRDQFLAIGDVILGVEPYSKKRIEGGYKKYRQERANGFPTDPFVRPPQYAPGPADTA